MTMSWMYEMNLPLKIGKEGQRLVDYTLLSLAGLTCFQYYLGSSNSQKAIKENLYFIGIHAGEKRFQSEERVMPSTIMAICQYHFMLRLTKPYAKDSPLKTAIDYAIQTIERLMKHFDLPPFEPEDDVIGVEVYPKGQHKGEVMKIEDVDKLDKGKCKIMRALPVNPTAIGFKIDRSMGFVNSCGDVSETSKRLKKLLRISVNGS